MYSGTTGSLGVFSLAVTLIGAIELPSYYYVGLSWELQFVIANVNFCHWHVCLDDCFLCHFDYVSKFAHDFADISSISALKWQALDFYPGYDGEEVILSFSSPIQW